MTEHAWAHVLQRRPDLAGSETLVRDVVELPDFVRWDADYPARENFYRWIIGEGRYLKGCVAYDDSGTGVVVTVHPTGRVKQTEQQRWP